MSAAPLSLEIRIHLEDGRVVRYAQDDIDIARTILDHVQPTKFYEQHPFILGGHESMTAFQSTAVVRVDFITDLPLDWPFHYGAQDICEITEEEFRQRYSPEYYEAIWEGRKPTPEILTVYGEMELVNGERIFVEIKTRVEPRLPIEQGLLIQQILASPSLHARRRNGGMSLMNPAKIVRLAFYPGMPSLPPGAWSVSRLAD